MKSAAAAIERAAASNADDERVSLSEAAGLYGRWAPYVQTAHSRVKKALMILEVGDHDSFVDLGCGDGRVALSAAIDFDCASSTGIDLSPALVRCCRRSAAAAGFDCSPHCRIRFLLADLALFFEKSEDPVRDAVSTGMDDDDALKVVQDATCIYAYLHPMVMGLLTPCLLRAIARGVRVLTLEHHLPSANDRDAIAMLPGDCQPLVHLLVPAETHLYGQMRLYRAASPLDASNAARPAAAAPAPGSAPSSPASKSVEPLKLTCSAAEPIVACGSDRQPTGTDECRRRVGAATLELHGHTVRIFQQRKGHKAPWRAHGGAGGSIWPASAALAQWLEAQVCLLRARIMHALGFATCFDAEPRASMAHALIHCHIASAAASRHARPADSGGGRGAARLCG